MSNIKVKFPGGAREVTGSNFLIEIKNNHQAENAHKYNFKSDDCVRILIDCGMPQGDADHGDTWKPFVYDPASIDYLLVTHAHLDHIGKIGFLINQGFSGKIISTKATREIARPAMEDAYHLVFSQAERDGLDEAPYSMEDIEIAFTMWKAVEYKEEHTLAQDISARWTDASHVLGSAMIQVNAYGEKVLFTGDMGNNSLLLQEADIPTDSDHVFMECVYGNRAHEHMDERSENLKKVILENIKHKGNLIIPAFSIERTQEVLSEINDLVEKHEMPLIPVYLDSPLGIEITHIFHHYKHLLRQDMQDKISKGDDIFNFPGLHMSHTRDESMAINTVPGPKIVIAGSGMLAGGRVVHHVKRYLENFDNTILMVGYQAHGTLGSKLLDPRRESVYIGEANLKINARVLNLSGYSAHRDVNALCDFVEKVKGNAKSINLILGDIESLEGFKQTIKNKYNIDAFIPEKNDVLDL
jgi:metallo-beta-lactamase family protein